MTASTRIRLVRIAHVYYIHENLNDAREFLHNFGFTITEDRGDSVFYKGYGGEPFLYCASKGPENSFGGAAFVVESIADLELASQILPRATPVHDLDGPGGGKRVTFYDPVDGFPMHLVHGQEYENGASAPAELPYNFPASKHRPVNHTQRFTQGPAPVHKLGHFGCCVTDFAKTFDFYTSHFNLKPSDVIYNEEGRDITAFLHLDRGKEQVDHHTFFFFEGPKFHVHHSSFEVHDFDTQALGHQWLEKHNYELAWGIGRHVLGSQIFDYWWDPSKFVLEHYADGDLVDESTPVGREEFSLDSFHTWGPSLPPKFLK